MKRVLLAVSLVVLSGCSGPSPQHPTPAASSSAPTRTAGPACDAGGQSDCDDLAEKWTSMEVTKHDDEAKRAAASLQKGCDQHKIASACMGYALMVKYGHATGKRDNAGSKPYFDKLPELGDLNGFRGKEKTPAGEKALAAAVADCAKGRARACAQVGWAAYNGHQREKSVRDAYLQYKKACELGSGTGCRWAGHFAVTYPDAQGADGKALLERGCNVLGNGGACDELAGDLERQSNDVWPAVPLYKKGCDLGNRTACAHAGAALAAKAGHEAEGKALLQKACDAEDEIGCKALKGN